MTTEFSTTTDAQAALSEAMSQRERRAQAYYANVAPPSAKPVTDRTWWLLAARNAAHLRLIAASWDQICRCASQVGAEPTWIVAARQAESYMLDQRAEWVRVAGLYAVTLAEESTS